MGTNTPNFNLYKPAVGEVGWGATVDTNWDTIDANLTNALPRAYLAGCQLSNDGGSPNTKIDISAGQAQDVNNAGAMTLTAIIKDISASWAVGTGNGGLAGALTLTASTWYHVFVIKRTDTNVVDAYFDSSVSAANIPAPYTLFRRVGSVKVDGSKNLLPFAQDGDYFRWKTSVLDVSQANPGTSAVLAALSVPLGLTVQAIMNVLLNGSTTGQFIVHISDPAENDETPSLTAAPLGSAGVQNTSAFNMAFRVVERVNTSQQIRYRLSASGASDHFYVATLGWYDTRGKNG